MELDKRIKEGKRPLTCFDTEQAKQFIGKKCYFSDDARDFINLDKADGDTLFYVAELQNIWTAEEYCFADNSNDYRFILPFEWVKLEEPEKKYRPYTLAEWADKHEIGEIIHFSYKDGRQEFNVMYTGYVIEHGEDIQDVRTIGRIMLLGTAYFLEDLFENYVICINGEWKPFGVIEDD